MKNGRTNKSNQKMNSKNLKKRESLSKKEVRKERNDVIYSLFMLFILIFPIMNFNLMIINFLISQKIMTNLQ